MQNRIKKLLEERNMNAKELADQIGMSGAALRYYVRQETQPKPEMAQKIARVFDVSPEYVMGLRDDAEPIVNWDEIPLYGFVHGSKQGEAVVTDEPVDYLERPCFIAKGQQAYAVTVTGSSMSPRFNPRDIVYVAPRLPVEAGDYVIVQFIENDERCAIIKQLVSADDEKVVLHQINPSSNFSIERKRIVALDRISGIRM